MYNKKQSGERIKSLRQKKKISQTELSKITETTREQISQYETGKKGLSVEVLCRIADYFKVSTDYILGRTDNTSQFIDNSPFREE